MKTLHVKKLVKIYKKRIVVNEISIDMKQGEVVGLLGPNGAGKTTTFYMVVGFVKPDSGKIFIDDKDITKLPMYKRANLGVGYLPQEASVFRKLTVEENLMAILETRNITREEMEYKKDELLNYLNISHLAKQKAFTLSGGERRRTEIARALTTEPRFLLLDEPFAGVDPIAVADIQSIIKKLKKRNLGVMITDHNVRETLKITDRAYILAEGKILISGKKEKLIKSKKARKTYLGHDFKM
ncbi:MAG: LPS export ABC transporter ATP-binding protein [Spirochaetes bacterium]|nr:LPS export ABC transporter ATP-binding protein [Spirochaetota bacterium]MCK5266798.1 LPS export ABC transporter ATP-binding protein [Spirochaetota bacterium]